MASAIPLGQLLVLLRRVGVLERRERADEAGDGAEEAGQGDDVGHRPQRADAGLHLGQRVGHGLFHGLRDRGLTAVQPVEAGLGDARDRRGGGLAQLLGAVDVVGGEQALDLLEERLGVQVATPQEVHRALDDERDHDRQEERVDDEERPALLENVA
jgi:hypothetical protein